VFSRDIEQNSFFNFRTKQIRPTKKDDGRSSMESLFDHLTCKASETSEGNRQRNVFEMARSVRLHWIRYHIEEKKQANIEIFSSEDRINGKTVIRTYIFDVVQNYVIILEPQRSGLDYYLITAYHLDMEYGKKQILKKHKKKLDAIY